ncbi:hydrolase of the HAD superfamily [Pyrenophora tritici-repentis]|uniref:Hydrolase HAD superfamily n=1 Tax=Pyrenophora tritici-repentis TaxID=45151 RepID=A0A2W1D1B5_9PLEO|nr:HAD-superfamily phosphatase [Pyrenophora tritici-repentis]KAF7449055.1 HAD-superfamily phosphatase [Pyrenophora tritici-repentis]KAF7570947.1 hydrolase HAD superfamily [Pyrenophora tritici-repentis]KAG9384005.1 HAD-superfamily phosphatase [Pyrenophora tritici-repentis]KAI0576821.1 HAD-superfamily phosphatase [Pyrenophora tritici-repentis]
MNISGTLNVFRLLREPTLCLPQHTVSTFNHLPIPLSKAFPRKDGANGQKEADIRAVVLDKDNCFAVPHTNEIHKPYEDHFQRLRRAYPGTKLLIVSNTAGTSSDKDHAEAAILEANTGIKVLRHSTKKPGCKEEVMAYFTAHPESGVTKPEQIAVVGDRLSTDIMMANLMGSYGVWVRDGVQGRGFFARMEDRLQGFLFRKGYTAPDPSDNQFQ